MTAASRRVRWALLQSGLFGLEVNPPDDKGPELAYFGVLGFIAGFNERFAQDVVSTSAGGLGTTLSTPQSGAPAAQTG